MKDGGDKEGFWTVLDSGLQCVCTLSHLCLSNAPVSMSNIVAQVSYILPILDSITGKSGTIPRFRQFGRGWVLRRLKAGASRKDLFYHLVR